MAKPANYRRNVCVKILEAIARGESVSIIGVGSSGKSNVARHLMRADARAACLGMHADGMFGVLVDCMKYVDADNATSLYRLILQSLAQATQYPDAPQAVGALHAQFSALLEKAFDTDQFDRVRYYLELAIDAMFKAGVRALFFVLDDFDHALKKAPGQAINSLRGLRDSHKNKLMYLVVTRKELAFLRDESEYEDFAEIVTPITIPVGMYAYADAQFAAGELIERWNLAKRVDATGINNAIEWSGSHPGLLKAILNAVNRNAGLDINAPDTLSKLYNHRDIAPECDKIWESLEPDERATIAAAVSGSGGDMRLIGRLRNKELLRERPGGRHTAFSPLFEDYVLRLAREAQPGLPSAIEIDAAAGSIKIAGRRIHDVDETEFRLFERLYTRRGRPVTSRDLLEVMYASSAPGGRYSGMPEQRLERYMESLMNKVNSGYRYITVEGDAYRFKE